MYKEKIFTTFKVYEATKTGRLTEKEMQQLAIDHFNDIVDTFGLPQGSYMEKYDETRQRGRKKVFHYKIVSAGLPRNSFGH